MPGSWDDHAAETFRLNFPEIKLYHGDIAKLESKEALKMAGIKCGELDVLDGSPPCQGFSTAGLRVMEDPRNSLFREYIRIIEAFRPRAIVMENVSGMVKGEMKSIFNDILAALKDAGYSLAVRVLNASWYGVPQSRQRVIFIGTRKDLALEPGHPDPKTGAISFHDACAGIDAGGPHLTGRMRTVYQITRRGESFSNAVEKIGARAVYFTWRRLSWGELAPTIVKQSASMLIHPDEARYISISAAKRCGSFPDEFVIPGKFKDQAERIGNSVPPLMMREIALHVRKILSL